MGSGWQSYVAYINLDCYYIIGVPLGFLMGWFFNQGVVVCFVTLFVFVSKKMCSYLSRMLISNALRYDSDTFANEIEQRESGRG